MDKFYTFCLGLSLGLMTGFFMQGDFWLGMLAGIPVGGLALFTFIVAIMGLDGDGHHYGEES